MFKPFSVSISADSARPFSKKGYNYVALSNGSTYAIVIHNNHDTRCDADVYVDGERVGGWVIPAYSSVKIERPADVARKFTFFEEHSSVAKSTGAVPGLESNGLINVIFKPEKHYISTYPDYVTLSSQEKSTKTSVRSSTKPLSSRPLSSKPVSSGLSSPRRSINESLSKSKAGVTVLGDDSDQRFNEVPPLRDDQIDWPLSTEISLRLVVKDRQDYISIHHKYPPRLDDISSSEDI
jgi:hypothetical protein